MSSLPLYANDHSMTTGSLNWFNDLNIISSFPSPYKLQNATDAAFPSSVEYTEL